MRLTPLLLSGSRRENLSTKRFLKNTLFLGATAIPLVYNQGFLTLGPMLLTFPQTHNLELDRLK